jgi:hypothetical protein
VALGLSASFEGYRLNAVSGLGIVLVLAGNVLVLAHKQPSSPAPGSKPATTGTAQALEA